MPKLGTGLVNSASRASPGSTEHRARIDAHPAAPAQVATMVWREVALVCAIMDGGDRCATSHVPVVHPHRATIMASAVMTSFARATALLRRGTGPGLHARHVRLGGAVPRAQRPVRVRTTLYATGTVGALTAPASALRITATAPATLVSLAALAA